jgi:hypothetical protein
MGLGWGGYFARNIQITQFVLIRLLVRFFIVRSSLPFRLISPHQVSAGPWPFAGSDLEHTQTASSFTGEISIA